MEGEKSRILIQKDTPKTKCSGFVEDFVRLSKYGKYLMNLFK